MNNAQLPDLLNGTVNNNNMNLDIDSKQLLKNLGNFGSINNHGELKDDGTMVGHFMTIHIFFR